MRFNVEGEPDEIRAFLKGLSVDVSKDSVVEGVSKGETPKKPFFRGFKRGKRVSKGETTPEVFKPLESKEKPLRFKGSPAHRDYMARLEGVVRRVIDSSGTIDFRTSSYTLNINSVDDWISFCTEFMSLSAQISDYFNVPNKWKLSRIGKYDSLVYGGA